MISTMISFMGIWLAIRL